MADLGLEIGSVFELEITGYSHKAEGVGRYNNKVIFVKQGIKGERLRVEITSKHKGIFYAGIKEIVQASPWRVSPPCIYYPECGGCNLQHMAYEEQLRFKQDMVESSLKRLGRLDLDCNIQSIIGMWEPWHYRNKGIFHATNIAGQISFGFRQEFSHEVVTVLCPCLFSPKAISLLELLTKLLNNVKYQPVTASITQVLLRQSNVDGAIMLILAVNNQANISRDIWREIYSELSSYEVAVFGTIIDDGSVNIWQNQIEFASSQHEITMNLGGAVYTLAPASFFQINSVQATKLLEQVRTMIPMHTDSVIDLYCGIGTIGIYLAKHLATDCQITGIEIVDAAIANSKKNAEINNLTNCQFILGKAEAAFHDLSAPGSSSEVIILDPPRGGCHSSLINTIVENLAETVIYVSCNPATLARDLKIFADKGYQICQVQPVDMFPQSIHCEVVILLQRCGETKK